jgi:hypothetical protein
LWLPSDDPRISSFEEAVAQTYDDSGLSIALDKSMAAEVVGAEAVARLEDLLRVLHSVDSDCPVEDLIASPEMEEVRGRAAAALAALSP